MEANFLLFTLFIFAAADVTFPDFSTVINYPNGYSQANANLLTDHNGTRVCFLSEANEDKVPFQVKVVVQQDDSEWLRHITPGWNMSSERLDTGAVFCDHRWFLVFAASDGSLKFTTSSDLRFWNDAETLVDSIYIFQPPALACDSETGDVLAAWKQGNSTAYSIWSGGRWGDHCILEETSPVANLVAVASHSTSRKWFIAFYCGLDICLAIRSMEATECSSDFNRKWPNVNSRQVRISTDSSGSAMISWSDYEIDRPFNIKFAISKDAGDTWSDAYKLTADDPSLPEVNICPCPTISLSPESWIIFWRSQIGSRYNNIYYRLVNISSDLPTFTPAQMVESSEDIPVSSVTAAYDGKQQLILAWVQAQPFLDDAPVARYSIARVSGHQSSTTGQVSESDSPEKNNRGLTIGLSVGFVALLLISLGIFIIVKRVRRRENKEEISLVSVSNVLIDASDVLLKEELGRGNFGIVYKALYKKNREVAAKKLNSEVIDRDSLFKELEIMKLIPRHPNIVELVGVFLNEKDIFIISNFCPGGCLKNVLNSDGVIDRKLQLKWSLEIARGMVFLHTALPGIEIIHRDLAARNILLNDNVAVVADFGMSRLKPQDSDYAKTQTAVGPLKWMSPESLSMRKFSVKSDVFSYGVTLFEVFSRQNPWAAISNTEAAYQVVEGGRISIPSTFPVEISQVITSCWKQLPEDRPDFRAVVNFLEKNT
eukprot:TRINITY_DN9249_c0_g1_i2.p1 TRINITY_DN9249_c0_g1~~TRINITY_DN9249_c0_g1_i2.p1  ORF type:complete len:713 (+),score=81.30 TRINITY_DN9249_c0_g1_i2:118-2256(+)